MVVETNGAVRTSVAVIVIKYLAKWAFSFWLMAVKLPRSCPLAHSLNEIFARPTTVRQRG